MVARHVLRHGKICLNIISVRGQVSGLRLDAGAVMSRQEECDRWNQNHKQDTNGVTLTFRVRR
jgi:hypothetical protein